MTDLKIIFKMDVVKVRSQYAQCVQIITIDRTATTIVTFTITKIVLGSSFDNGYCIG